MTTNCVEPTLQPLTADEDLHSAMHMLSTALTEHIKKCKPTIKINRAVFQQLVDLFLSDWSTFFILPKSLKFKKIFQRALGIQPQIAQLDEKSFDIHQHQHDLECLTRIAVSIKRPDIEEKIRKLKPYRAQLPVKVTSVAGSKTKDAWAQLKDEAKDLYFKEEWELAMIRFSQAICLNSEEAILYAGRAMCEIRLSKYQLAIEDAKDAVELNSKCEEYRRILSEASLGLYPHNGELSNTTPTDFYVLGVNYLHGNGELVQDLQQAEKYLKLAADAGHLEANLMIGKLFLGQQKSKEAMPFIRHAAEKGLAEAQYQLGLLLTFGDGCNRNEPIAKNWLLKAQNQGFQPEEQKNRKWVDNTVRNASAMLLFESANRLDCKEITLTERHNRFLSYSFYKFDGIEDLLEQAITFKKHMPANQSDPAIKTGIDKWMPLMIQRAKKGSYKAQCFFEAHQLFVKANELFRQNQVIESFKMLRKGRRLWSSPIIDTTQFEDAAEKMFKENIQNAEAFYLVVCLNKSISLESKLWLALEAVELEPSVPEFHHALGLVYEQFGDFTKGLQAINRALKLYEHPEWLFDRATLLRLSKNRPDFHVINAYEKFLESSPPDGRYVPEAHYCISLIHYHMSNMKKSNVFMRKGLRAENLDARLPCFKLVDPDDCVPKYCLKKIYKAEFSGFDRNNDESLSKLFEVFCAVCHQGNPSVFCHFCQNWVCGPDEYDTTGVMHKCQIDHVFQHKKLIHLSLGSS